jgi:DNA-binding NarL/FixJ family response regulator
MDHLNDTVAAPLGNDLALHHAEVESLKRLIAEKETSIAFLTSQIETHKRQSAHDIVNAVERVVLPVLTTLHEQLLAPQRQLLETAISNLKDLLSPFVERLDHELMNLTPTELRICTLIRQGLSVKEVAAAERISPATISTHRRSIRRKMGLAHSKTNLATFLNLRSFGSPPAGTLEPAAAESPSAKPLPEPKDGRQQN